MVRRADAPRAYSAEPGRVRPGCRPGWSRRSSVRAAPGSSAGRRRPRAGGSRRSGAGCAARPSRDRRLADPLLSRRRTSEVESRRPPPWRRRARLARARRARARPLEVAPRPLRRLADGHQPVLASPLPSTRSRSDSKSSESRSRLTISSARKPAGVGELEHRPVAHLERRAPGSGPAAPPSPRGRAPAAGASSLFGVGRARRGSGPAAGADQGDVETPHRGELAGHARPRQRPAPESPARRRAGPGRRARRAPARAVAQRASSARSRLVGAQRVRRDAARDQLAAKRPSRPPPRRVISTSVEPSMMVRRGQRSNHCRSEPPNASDEAALRRPRLSRCRSACRLDLVVELDHVGDRHPHAAVRGAAVPSEPMSSVPWMPAPSKMPIQRALSGFSGTPPGTTVPARSPAQSELGTFQAGSTALFWMR